MIPSLSIENFSFSYGRRSIFSDVTFKTVAGALTHVRGPNGCGKSTFLSVLAGLNTGSGAAIWSGEARRVAFLESHRNGLYPSLDARANLGFWAELHGADVGEIDGVLTRVGIAKMFWESFPVSTFSLGMKRRLGLARVLLTCANCWLLDEPSFGLDESGKQMLDAILCNFLKQGGICLIAEHDLSYYHGEISQVLDLSNT